MAKQKNAYSNFEAHIYNPDNKSLRVEKVINLHANTLETENDFYEFKDHAFQQYVNESTGKIVYVCNIDLPTKVEAQNLKQLRRSVALMRIFDYDKEKPFDLFKLMPWLVIILLVLFK